MVKLKDLWQEYKNLESDDIIRRKELQKKINEIESWMIQRGIKKDGLTIWRNHNSIVSDSYPTNSGAVYIEDLEQLKEIQQCS